MQLSLRNVNKIREGIINLDGLTVIAGVNDSGKSTVGKMLFSLVKAIYKNEFSEKIRQEYPDLPPYRYNLVVKMGEDDYVYVSAPVSMNDQFDEIMEDPSLIKEIQKDRCAISAYSFYSKRDNEWRYGLEFCE